MCGWRQLLGLTATGAAGVCGWRQLLGLTATGAAGVCGWRQLLGLTATGAVGVWLETAAWTDSNWSSRCVVGDSCLD